MIGLLYIFAGAMAIGLGIAVALSTPNRKNDYRIALQIVERLSEAEKYRIYKEIKHG